MKKSIVFLSIITSLFSCGTAEVVTEESAIETILVEVPENLKVDYHELFEDFSLIPLETNEQSIIGSINRIIIHHHQFFILDKGNNKIIVFDEKGQFIRRIQKVGKGPGEYQSLMDFTIDDQKDQLILHAYRPYKLYYFDFMGNFIMEEETDKYYDDVVYQDDELILVNDFREKEYKVLLQDLSSNEQNGFLPFSEVKDIKTKPGHSLGTGFPKALKSKSTFITFPFSSIIYQVQHGEVFPRYKIDFGDLNLPEKFYENGMTPTEVLKEAYEKGYGTWISNFRESKDFISFRYGVGLNVIYNKKIKKSKVFKSAKKEDHFVFRNIYGFDGKYQENTILSILEGHNLRAYMDILKSNPEQWEKLSSKYKDIDTLVNMESNPVLMMAKLKIPEMEARADF